MIIKDVPAAVCQQCWEKYLSSSVYKELERLAKSKNHIMDKMTVDILVFGAKDFEVCVNSLHKNLDLLNLRLKIKIEKV